jgi:hypothetical protein
MQLPITFGPKDLVFPVWDMVKGSCLWCKQDWCGYFLQIQGVITVIDSGKFGSVLYGIILSVKSIISAIGHSEDVLYVSVNYLGKKM